MAQDTTLTDTGERIRELSENELQIVAGGRKAGEGQKEFLVVKMEDCLVSSF